jgi:hypothetical protein
VQCRRSDELNKCVKWESWSIVKAGGGLRRVRYSHVAREGGRYVRTWQSLRERDNEEKSLPSNSDNTVFLAILAFKPHWESYI